MEDSIYSGPKPALRVLLAGGAGGSGNPFVGWLWDQGGLVVAGPAATVDNALVLAGRLQPHVVLLDFDGLPVSISHTISLFKKLTPTPGVFVLTYEVSDALRDRCRAMRADAVFHKTAELDQLAAALAALRPAPQSPDFDPAHCGMEMPPGGTT